MVNEVGDGTVCNRKPIADAGVNQVVNEFQPAPSTARTVVTLSGTGSFDPDGQPLTYQWRQLNGPPVGLSANNVATPTFTADVSETTIYTFELTVNDGDGDERAQAGAHPGHQREPQAGRRGTGPGRSTKAPWTCRSPPTPRTRTARSSATPGPRRPAPRSR